MHVAVSLFICTQLTICVASDSSESRGTILGSFVVNDQTFSDFPGSSVFTRGILSASAVLLVVVTAVS